MNQIKTAVILLIICVVGIGALIYANREKFASKEVSTTVSESETEE